MIKLADFSWSICSKEFEKRSTFCGSLNYLTPEMVNGEQYDEKIDNWGIGVLTFELLTGKPPFEASSMADTLKNIK